MSILFFRSQLHGFEVDIINSVQLSNHTGYKKWTGQVLTSVDLGDLLDGLKTNDLLRKYTHLLTGYIGSASFLEKVADVIMELKKIKPDLLYVCDPVMGDNGQLYVPESLLPVYKEKIIPLADIITPNQFELQLLTDVEIRNESDVLKAIDILHDRGVKTVAVSSTELGSEDTLIAYGSYNDPEASQSSKLKVEFPKLPIQFTGSGDLFAASLLIWMTKTDCNLMVSQFLP
ncbi:PDXK (predicted) [Pycnogonum litorale]